MPCDIVAGTGQIPILLLGTFWNFFPQVFVIHTWIRVEPTGMESHLWTVYNVFPAVLQDTCLFHPESQHLDRTALRRE